MPPMPKVGPEIKFEGHPSIMPTIIPVLPEPLVTVEVPKGGYNTAPKVTTDISQKKVTLDLSQVSKLQTQHEHSPRVDSTDALSTCVCSTKLQGDGVLCRLQFVRQVLTTSSGDFHRGTGSVGRLELHDPPP